MSGTSPSRVGFRHYRKPTHAISAISARLMTAQEEERRYRVARDIHDSFCQQFGALASELGGVASELSPNSPAQGRLQALQALSLRAADEAIG